MSVEMSGGYETTDQGFSVDRSFKENFGIALDTSRHFKMFNRFHIMEGLDPYHSGVGYIFMSKPQCNLSAENISMMPFYQYLQGTDMWDIINGSLNDSINGGATGNFIYPVFNLANSFDTKDVILTVTDRGENFQGQKVRYGGNTFESEAADSISITYTESKNLLMTCLHKTWIDYIAGVRSGLILPTMISRNEKIIDYAASVYFILTDIDGFTIRYWTKYTGLFPTSLPYSTFSWKKDDNSIRSVSVNYDYSFKEDLNPEILLWDFNRVSGVACTTSGNGSYANDTWCTDVGVERGLDATGKMVYKLAFGGIVSPSAL